jgi:hypothetical protein
MFGAGAVWSHCGLGLRLACAGLRLAGSGQGGPVASGLQASLRRYPFSGIAYENTRYTLYARDDHLSFHTAKTQSGMLIRILCC